MKVTQRTVIKNLNTFSFYVEEHEIEVAENDKKLLETIEVNNISCSLEIQKLLNQYWVYGKPPEIKSKRKKNFIENCRKRLGLKK